ncbi:MAG: hypothetical protein ACXAD7_02235 [Candidatus Kariarchaeaceae archaeon]|jgi:hypothetical protein
MSYEFTDNEAEQMWIFGNRLVIMTIVMAISGILGLFISMTNFGDMGNRDFVLFMEFIFLIFIAIVLYRPSDNFTRIATSEGRDIQELMRGIKEFSFAFVVTAILITIMGLLNFILIIDKV